MAIVKPIKVRVGNLAGLNAIIEYVKNPVKTQNGDLIYCKDCLPGKEFQQMVITKELFGKTTGRQYSHFVQSFDPKDNLSPEQAFQIGKEYIESIEKWNDFQVLMAVHTDHDYMHIHYIVNSVNSRDGEKWQCSQRDLYHFRERSDELCRKYHLNVIERGSRGHRSYGEYTAEKNGLSWKAKLATDIASCLQTATSRDIFHHQLHAIGISADFGKKNIMFTIDKGTYGLEKEMKCSNYRLMSYGDFSNKNIENHFKLNGGMLAFGYATPDIMQDCLLTLGAMKFPNDPDHLQNLYFANQDFDGMTKEEIEAYIQKVTRERLQRKAWAEWDMNNRQSGYVLENIELLLEELTRLFRDEQGCNYDFGNENDNEYEL